MGYQQISDYLNIPLTTVKNTISKKELEGKEKKGRGKHPKTTRSQDDAMVEKALENRDTTYFEIT